MLKQGVKYISSDESGGEGDECLYSRPLPWLKKKYQSSFRKLDKMWVSKLSVRSKRLLRSEAQGRPSDRSIPHDAPEYLLRDITNTSTSDDSGGI